MEINEAANVLSSLGLEGRLAIFRLLVRAGPRGVKAGDIAGALSSPPSTLTANLNVLSHAGLITRRRDGRMILYSANFGRMRELLAFLLADCCNGEPDICVPLMDVATRATCCASDAAEYEEMKS